MSMKRDAASKRAIYAALYLSGAFLAACASAPVAQPAPEPDRPRGPQLIHYNVPAGGYRSFASMREIERVCVDPAGANALRVSFEDGPPSTDEIEEGARVVEIATPGECVTIGGREFTIENDGEVDVDIQFVLPGDVDPFEPEDFEHLPPRPAREGADASRDAHSVIAPPPANEEATGARDPALSDSEVFEVNRDLPSSDE